MSVSLSCSDLRQVLTDTVADNGIIFDEQEIRQLVEVVIEECKNRDGAESWSLSCVTPQPECRVKLTQPRA